MGRGKLRMKQIEKEKTRGATLKKRSDNLKKKAYEFSILCDVDVCMIKFEPEIEDSPAKVEVWPTDPRKVERIIHRYRHAMAASGSRKKTFTISDYFNMRQKQARDELSQVSNANFKAKFPTWDDRINNFSPQQIASCLSKLDMNIEVVKRKIMLMKEDNKHKLLQSQSSNGTFGGFDARSRPSSSDNYIPASALHPWNQNISNNEINAHASLEILNHFDHMQGFPRKNSVFGAFEEQPKPLDIQRPSLSPAYNEALVKLSLSFNPYDKSLRMSTMNDLKSGVRSGIASSSNSSISKSPNNAMYAPPHLFSVRYDPRYGMPNNDAMFDPTLIHDPRWSAMHNNEMMFKEPNKTASESNCFYAPSMQPEGHATYNQQQLMMTHGLHQMPPYEFTDFYHDINEYEMKNKRQRF